MTAVLGNLLLACDDNVLPSLDAVRARKISALDDYRECVREEAELLALLELRKSFGAKIAGLPALSGISNHEAA